MPVHHWPVCKTRPVMSAWWSPLKSPTFTSTQVIAVDQVDHKLLVNEEPVEVPTHHWPLSRTRPIMSALPSPVKSPTRTSVQVTEGFQCVQSDQVKVEPPEFRPTHQSP